MLVLSGHIQRKLRFSFFNDDSFWPCNHHGLASFLRVASYDLSHLNGRFRGIFDTNPNDVQPLVVVFFLCIHFNLVFGRYFTLALVP